MGAASLSHDGNLRSRETKPTIFETLTNDADVYRDTFTSQAVLIFPGIGRIDRDTAVEAIREEYKKVTLGQKCTLKLLNSDGFQMKLPRSSHTRRKPGGITNQRHRELFAPLCMFVKEEHGKCYSTNRQSTNGIDIELVANLFLSSLSALLRSP